MNPNCQQGIQIIVNLNTDETKDDLFHAFFVLSFVQSLDEMLSSVPT